MPYAGARNDFAAVHYRLQASCEVVVFMPQLLQRFAIARLPVTETKVLAHENRFRPECADYDAGYELFGRQLRDRWRKGQDLDMSNAGRAQ
jgi:hypothetical protein